MPRHRISWTAATLVLAALASPLAARDKPATPATAPAIYQAVVDCRAIAEAAQRLACFDRTVGAMARAGETRDLVVLDRETMRETRKGLFGFSLPKLKLFGGGDVDARDEVREIESTIAGVRIADDGMPILTIAEGARWKQTEGRNVFPKAGQKIRIRSGALGSYFASVEGKAGVRVTRLAN